MKRRRNQSKSTMFLLLFLVILGIGIAYAVLTEQLTINNTVSYDAMKWDIGFTAVEDGWDSYMDVYIKMYESESGVTLEEMGVTREEFMANFSENIKVVVPTATISVDKKSIIVNCDLEMSSLGQACLVKAKIVNNSTFNIGIKDMQLTYDNKYISFSDLGWLNHSVYGEIASINEGQTLDAGENAEILLLIVTNKLTEDMLPSTDLSVPITLTLDFEEVDYSISDLAMLTTYSYNKVFWNEDYCKKIKNITIEDKINVPEEVVASWDMSLQKDGRVMSYIVQNVSDSAYYDLYIQSDEQLYANFDMSDWFSDFSNVDSINGLELLDTRYTTNMSNMFACTGYNSTVFTLDMSNFDTSNVENMESMFHSTGYSNPTFTLDVTNFDTSKVIDMGTMFYDTGYSSTVFTLDVSHFDTSNVTDMSWMFVRTGYNSSKFVTSITIRNPDVEDFDVMFSGAATKTGSQITVNYTSETSDLVDQMIATKSGNSNVVKGVQVN